MTRADPGDAAGAKQRRDGWCSRLAAASLLMATIAAIAACGTAGSGRSPRAESRVTAAAVAAAARPASTTLSDTREYIFLVGSAEQATEIGALGAWPVAGQVLVVNSPEQEAVVRESVTGQRGLRAAAGLPEVAVIDLRGGRLP